MLINSTGKNEKIVLGLLSYTFAQGVPSIEEIKALIEDYRSQDNKYIYLYKDEATDNYVGLIALEQISHEASDGQMSVTLNIERIGIIPSFADDQVGYRMFSALKETFPKATIIGTLGNVDIITEWTKQYHRDHDACDDANK